MRLPVAVAIAALIAVPATISPLCAQTSGADGRLWLETPGLGAPALQLPRTTPGQDAATYAHRFGRLHDLRRLDGDPYPGSPQHRLGTPGSYGITGHFVRPDRISPSDRLGD